MPNDNNVNGTNVSDASDEVIKTMHDVSLPADEAPMITPFTDQVDRIDRRQATKEVADNSVLSVMREMIHSMSTRMEAMEAAKTKPVTESTPEDNDFFSGFDDHRDLFDSKELFQERLDKSFERAINKRMKNIDERLSLYDEHIRSMPNQITRHVQESAEVRTEANRFFRENPDVDFRSAQDSAGKAYDTMFRSLAENVAKENPDASVYDVLDRARSMFSQIAKMPQKPHQERFSDNFQDTRFGSRRSRTRLSDTQQHIADLFSGSNNNF